MSSTAQQGQSAVQKGHSAWATTCMRSERDGGVLKLRQPACVHAVARGFVTQWDQYFEQYKGIYTQVPVMTLPGMPVLLMIEQGHCSMACMRNPCAPTVLHCKNHARTCPCGLTQQRAHALVRQPRARLAQHRRPLLPPAEPHGLWCNPPTLLPACPSFPRQLCHSWRAPSVLHSTAKRRPSGA